MSFPPGVLTLMLSGLGDSLFKDCAYCYSPRKYSKMFYSAVSVAFTSDNMELRQRLDGETLVWTQKVKS